MNLPGGRQSTLDYVKKLMWFPEPWVREPNFSSFPYARPPVALNPELPQFPQGTKVALLRQTVLIDNQGNLVPTRLTESLQIRVFRLDPKEAMFSDRANQDLFELRLRRKDLFAGRAGGLRVYQSTGLLVNNAFATNGSIGIVSDSPLTLTNNIIMGHTTGVSLTAVVSVNSSMLWCR